MKKSKQLHKSSFIEGTVVATLAIIITKILGMVYVIPFYSLVGEKGSALYAYAYNIYVIFLSIGTAGIPTAISKLVKEYSTLNNIKAKVQTYNLGKKLIMSISFIMFILLFCFAKPIAILILGELKGGNTILDVSLVIRLVSFALLVIPFLSVNRGFLQGHNIIKESSFSQIIEQLVRILFILVSVFIVLRICHLSVTNAVSFAVFGAFIGGFIAEIYLHIKMKNHCNELNLNYKIKDKKLNKEIILKIIKYAIPFVIIDIVISVYNFIDMVFISRTMTYLGFLGSTTEFVTTSIATWANKINMIVNSVAVGLTISLIPNIVESFTLKKWQLVEQRVNKALQILLITSLPMVIGISLLSDGIWSIFYGYNELGTKVLSVEIFTALFYNFNTVSFTILQSMDKFKTVYLSTFIGYITNALLDIPLMLLCYRLNISPFFGALLASMIGLGLSTYIALRKIQKDHNIKYQETIKIFSKIIIPLGIMILIVICLKNILPCNLTSKVSCIIYVSLISLIGGLSYLYLLYKNKVLEIVFGKSYLNKIIKKITFGKVNFS